MKPCILINGGPAYDRVFRSSSWIVGKTYPEAVAAAGGVPLMAVDPEGAEEYAAIADGLILTGSISYLPDPSLRERLQQEEAPKRPIFDSALYQAFTRAKKPVLGICLGLQVINVEQGGLLDQNFKFQDGVEHMMTAHTVHTVEDCFLSRLFGTDFAVNSRHNNRIRTLGKDLKAVAWSPDGVIEAIEHTKLPVYAVEWHPERMRGDIPEPPWGPDMTCLFQWFIEQCSKTGR